MALWFGDFNVPASYLILFVFLIGLTEEKISNWIRLFLTFILFFNTTSYWIHTMIGEIGIAICIIQINNEEMVCYCEFHGFWQSLMSLKTPFINSIKKYVKNTNFMFILAVWLNWVKYSGNSLFNHYKTNDQFTSYGINTTIMYIYKISLLVLW